MTQSVLTCRNGRSTSTRTLAVGLLVLAAALWSLTGLAVKLAAMEPFGFALWRALGAAVTAALIVPWDRGARPNLRWTLLATILNALVAGTVIWTMTRSTAAKGILLQYTGPVFCALMARLIQGRRLSRLSKASLIIAAVGIGIMVAAGDGEMAGGASAAGILCGIAYGGLILVLEKINQCSTKVNPFAVVMWMNLGTALLIAICAPSALHTAALPWQWMAAIGTGIVLTAIPYVLFQIALRYVHAVDASLVVLLEPVLNPVWVAVGTGEFPDKLTTIGGSATLAAAIIQATSVTRKQEEPLIDEN